MVSMEVPRLGLLSGHLRRTPRFVLLLNLLLLQVLLFLPAPGRRSQSRYVVVTCSSPGRAMADLVLVRSICRVRLVVAIPPLSLRSWRVAWLTRFQSQSRSRGVVAGCGITVRVLLLLLTHLLPLRRRTSLWRRKQQRPLHLQPRRRWGRTPRERG